MEQKVDRCEVIGFIACNPSKGNHVKDHGDPIIWESWKDAFMDLDGPEYAIMAVIDNGSLTPIENVFPIENN